MALSLSKGRVRGRRDHLGGLRHNAHHTSLERWPKGPVWVAALQPQYIFHRIQPVGLIRQPQGGPDRATGQAFPVQGTMSQFQAFAKAGKVNRMLAYGVAAA